MAFTLGIDIGTYETKGVLVDHTGAVRSQAARGAQDVGSSTRLGRA